MAATKSNTPMYRQVLILSTSQALFQTVTALVITVGALAGGQLAPSPQWATAPVASMFLGTVVVTVPASLWMAHVGRRPGFIVGALLGTLGGLVAAGGIMMESLLLLCIGTFLVGTYQAFAQFYRFAASEVSSDAFRPRAISLVLAGGVVAAILGPPLGRLGAPLLTPSYLGSFLILAVLALAAAGLLLSLNIPPPQETAATGPPRPFAKVIGQPSYLVALFGAATGYGVMIMAMTATPLAMAHHAHDLDQTAMVIQLHILGMFLPSFFTGSLIARFGVLKVMFSGVLLLAGHILMTLSGTGFGSFASALVLLGVGWNFLYVGGTAMLTRTYTVAERGRAQATNDLIILVVGFGASLAAGYLNSVLGWQVMNLVLLPWLGLAAAAIVWLGFAQRGVTQQA